MSVQPEGVELHTGNFSVGQIDTHTLIFQAISESNYVNMGFSSGYIAEFEVAVDIRSNPTEPPLTSAGLFLADAMFVNSFELHKHCVKDIYGALYVKFNNKYYMLVNLSMNSDSVYELRYYTVVIKHKYIREAYEVSHTS